MELSSLYYFECAAFVARVACARQNATRTPGFNSFGGTQICFFKILTYLSHLRVCSKSLWSEFNWHQNGTQAGENDFPKADVRLHACRNHVDFVPSDPEELWCSCERGTCGMQGVAQFWELERQFSRHGNIATAVEPWIEDCKNLTTTTIGKTTIGDNEKTKINGQGGKEWSDGWKPAHESR